MTDIEKKQIVDLLGEALDTRKDGSTLSERIQIIIDELDSPYAAPGTVVYVKFNNAWSTALVDVDGDGVRFNDGSYLPWGNVHEWVVAGVAEAVPQVCEEVVNLEAEPDQLQQARSYAAHMNRLALMKETDR